MSFDARSLERLQQLGRSLPKPLPKPETAAAAAPASQKRHRVETETDQQRARQAEQRQAIQRQASQTQSPTAGLQPRGASDELRPNRQRRAPANAEELELYTAFQQLLLEGDEEE